VAAHEVTHFTRVSRTETGTRINVPSVSLVAHSPARLGAAGHNHAAGASRMRATVDMKKGEEMSVQTSLKLWASTDGRHGRNVIGGDWRLRAQVDQPHVGARVTCMAWCPVGAVEGGHAGTGAHAYAHTHGGEGSGSGSGPGSPVLATGGSDGSVRVWRCENNDGKSWCCAYSITYRNCEVGAVAFSADGSIMAVAHRNVVSLWNFADTTLKATVVLPSNSNIGHVAFVEPRRAAHMGG
jgi:hypothetical protein